MYQVTMPLFFQKTYASLEDIEKDDDENAVQFCKKVELYREMDERFPTQPDIEAHVKTQNPKDFVEYLVNGEEFDAHWNPDRFEIQFKVKSNESLTEFRRSIDFISLADGPWESSDDNGWTVKTNPPPSNGENLFGPVGYEYGLTNFRPADVRVRLVPGSSALLTAISSAAAAQGGKRKSKRKNRK